MDVCSDTAALGREEGAQELVALADRAFLQSRQRDQHRDAASKCWQQRCVGIFRRSGEQEQRRLTLSHLSHAAEAFAVHQIEEHLLTLGWQPVHLVQEENATIRLLDIDNYERLLCNITKENPLDASLLYVA